jgi:hypothetical protein
MIMNDNSHSGVGCANKWKVHFGLALKILSVLSFGLIWLLSPVFFRDERISLAVVGIARFGPVHSYYCFFGFDFIVDWRQSIFCLVHAEISQDLSAVFREAVKPGKLNVDLMKKKIETADRKTAAS